MVSTAGEGGVVRVADPTRVVSPHLLVAQAVAAALRSVGTPAEAHSWESVVLDVDSDEGLSGPSRQIVAIVDGFDTSGVVEDVARLVRSGPHHVVVVTSGEAEVWWGGLLDGDRVDVTTTTSVVQLAQLVEHIRSGGSAPDAERRVALTTSWAKALERRHHVTSRIETLSPQQRRVLELLASGRQVSEVGALMGVTRGTVRSHVKALRAKLGVRSQLEAVAMLHEAYAPGIGETPVPRPRRASTGAEVRPRL